MSTVKAGQNAALAIVEGGITVAGTTNLSATAGDLGLMVGTGDVGFAGTSTLSAGVNQTLTVGTGDVSFEGTTLVNAGQDFALNIGTGDLSFSGVSTVQAQRDALMGVGTGDVQLNGTSTLRAIDGDLAVRMLTGDLQIRNDSAWYAGRDLSVSLGVGDVMQINNTRWTAARDVLLGMGRGDLLSQQRGLVVAARDVSVRIDAGDIGIQDDSRWVSGRDQFWEISESGAFAMADAQTELQSARNISLNIADDVRIDWMQAGETLGIRSVRGAILDNTAAETDLLAARHLLLDAAQGIGRPWADNLNTFITDTLTANNRESGGINLQNWVGLTLGASGLVNRGQDHLVLISGGKIEHGQVIYGTPQGQLQSVVNRPGYKSFLINNQSEAYLLEQWGNRTLEFVNVRTTGPAAANDEPADAKGMETTKPLATLIPTQNHHAGEASDRLLDWVNGLGKTPEMSRPIRLADVLNGVKGSALQNPFGTDLMPFIQTVASDLGVAEQPKTIFMAPFDLNGAALRNDLQGFDDLDYQDAPALSNSSIGTDLPLAWNDRPVLQQAHLLGDDSLDLPLIEDESSEVSM